MMHDDPLLRFLRRVPGHVSDVFTRLLTAISGGGWKHATAGQSAFRQLLRTALLLPLFVVVYYAAYWLRFGGPLGPDQWALFTTTLLWVVVVKSVAFRWFRIDSGWGRYATFHDLVALGKAATVTSLVLVVVDGLLLARLVVPRSIVLLDWGATIVGVGGLRAALRIIREQGGLWFAAATRTPVLIVGANDSGEALLRALHRRRGKAVAYRVVGFLDENVAAVGTRIGGVPVVGTLDQMCTLARNLSVADVLVTAGGLPGRALRRLVDDGRRHAIRVRILPSYEQLLDQRIDLQPRPVAIDDLLRRDPVKLDLHAISCWIDRRVVLVTGSAGSIGSEICRQLLQLSPARLVLVDRSENGQFYLEQELRRLAPGRQIDVCLADMTDQARIESVFAEYRPDIVFHAAAYKHVPLMEANPGEAVKNIVLATQFVADAAERSGADAFVMISTDKAVKPSSIMGACKRVAELYVQSLAGVSTCQYVTVRFGNVLDSAGSVVPLFRQQIACGGPVTVTHPEMTRYFMTIPEASQLVIQAGAMGRGGEIFVLDMGDPVRILDLATDMVRLSGLTVGEDIEIVYTGTRPGEKLFEQLCDESERRTGTSHPKIMVVEAARPELVEILAAINCLAGKMNGPAATIVAQLQQILPGFRHPAPTRPVIRPTERTAA
jgi:FlaA1/EpsC-like NDP-sugar epimerase